MGVYIIDCRVCNNLTLLSHSKCKHCNTDNPYAQELSQDFDLIVKEQIELQIANLNALKFEMLKEELEKIPDTTPRYVEVTKWRCPKCKEGYELDKIQKCTGCNFLFEACEDKDFNALIYSERIKVSNSTD